MSLPRSTRTTSAPSPKTTPTARLATSLPSARSSARLSTAKTQPAGGAANPPTNHSGVSRMASAKHSFASTGNIEIQRGGQRVLVGQYAFGEFRIKREFQSATGEPPGRGQEVAFQEQADEPGWRHHRPV